MSMTFPDVLERIRQVAADEHDKGARFERLMAAWLRRGPLYGGTFSDVWLWRDFPFKAGTFSGKDLGIDIVARTHDGDFWAVQCKFYAAAAVIGKPAVDSFLATSGRTFVLDDGTPCAFAQRLWIATTGKWGPNAEETLERQNPPVMRINPAGISLVDDADWEALLEDRNARRGPRALFDYQERALEAADAHFASGGERGRLIMACGTGKTFTSLRIAERLTGGRGLAVFLAPSIALVGQTLRAWKRDAVRPFAAVCVCSDSKVGGASDDISPIDLGWPASTDPASVRRALDRAAGHNPDGLTVIFSTYQSIDVVSAALGVPSAPMLVEAPVRTADLVICDEAHRTTGVTLKGEDESAFVRVHDNNFLPARRRLYMTATPRLYSDAGKKKAQEADAVLCSMDDEKLYGPEIFRMGFGEAVRAGRLTDYKVFVLTVDESQLTDGLKAAVRDGMDVPEEAGRKRGAGRKEIGADDASRLIGCISALSKRMIDDDGTVRQEDPDNPAMRRAVAFCRNIRASDAIAEALHRHGGELRAKLGTADIVAPDARHVDGTMPAPERDEKLAWLSAAEGDDCRILCNVRCLSEGVDVPSLDAVLFLSPRSSQVDVVQSVGRVMRVSPGKRFGYIVIPVVTPLGVAPEDALNDNARFATVWMVLNALRAHDERFDAIVNQVELNRRTPPKIVVSRVDFNGDGTDGTGDPGGDGGGGTAGRLELPIRRLTGFQEAMYARLVQKVGSRRYWERWAADVARIAVSLIGRIGALVAEPGDHREKFLAFLGDLRRNLNPSVTEADAIEMLAQHVITGPVFEAVFGSSAFTRENPVSRVLQGMVDLLKAGAAGEDFTSLERFYQSVRDRASGLDNPEARQKVVLELYDNFFRTAFPRTVEKLGIVYTPVEVVDFVNRSVADVLEKEFGRSLSDENVHVLDPFTGTGTFLVRMIQSGLIRREDLQRKYLHELHANEIVLLAYYVASVNIENAYHAAMGVEQDGSPASYVPFPGICLTDTFQLGEDDGRLVTPVFMRNSQRVEEQRKAPITVIIGNPPYSVGAKTAEVDAKTQGYPRLEQRIAATYAMQSNAVSQKALYDSYIKAFRWASDRLDAQGGGVIAFVTNGYWLDSNATDGFRKCLEAEFSAIWVYNLRGNQRTSGDVSKREGGKIFGSGSRTPVAVTVLVRKPGHAGKAVIRHCDIGDYLSREDKLKIVAGHGSILAPGMAWETIMPDEHGDWLNQRNDNFSAFIPLGDKKDKEVSKTIFYPVYSNGIATNRDSWCLNFSRKILLENIFRTISFYNNQIETIPLGNIPQDIPCEISWSRSLLNSFEKRNRIIFHDEGIRISLYRPFCRENMYFDSALNEMMYQIPKLFPTQEHENRVICLSGTGDRKGFSSIMTDAIPNLDLLEKAQCFPLHYYEKRTAPAMPIGRKSQKLALPGAPAAPAQPVLMGEEKTEYVRRDAVTDVILGECRARYGGEVTKEDIFFYVYGLLHSPDYRTAFAADLKKMLPRLPLVDGAEDFWAFSEAGRGLADLHLDYENRPAPEGVVVTGAEHGDFRVTKMRFANRKDKGDKSAIEVNAAVTVSGIPAEVYDYVVNGRSAVEWIMERYQVKTDKASGIVNDPNAWAEEHGRPRYILDLLLGVMTVSLETMRIVRRLPKLAF